MAIDATQLTPAKVARCRHGSVASAGGSLRINRESTTAPLRPPIMLAASRAPARPIRSQPAHSDSAMKPSRHSGSRIMPIRVNARIDWNPWVAARVTSWSTANGRLRATTRIGPVIDGRSKTCSASTGASNASTAPATTAADKVAPTPIRTAPRSSAWSDRARLAATNFVIAIRMPSPHISAMIARSANRIAKAPSSASPERRAISNTARKVAALLITAPAMLRRPSVARLPVPGCLVTGTPVSHRTTARRTA